MTRSLRGARWAPVLLGVALAGGALLLGGPGGARPGEAGDRYRAGEPVTVRSALPSDEAAGTRHRALALARALGIPVGTGTLEARVVDRFERAVLDEVVTTDGRGRRLGIVRTDARGRLSMAVRLGWRDAGGRRIGPEAAARRATALVRAAGLAVPGRPVVTATADRGWRATWGRVVDGVAVVGDGVTVTLFADGTVHAVARRERATAARPATLLAEPEARTLARGRLGKLLGPAADQAKVVGARLAWVAPNDTFDGRAPDAPDPVLRLAWVVEARSVAPLADRLRALELYLDAGDGRLLGGDLLR